MSVEIRKAEKKDIDRISVLWYELAKMHEELMEGYELSEKPIKAWKKVMKKNFEKNNMETFIAVDDGEIIGFTNAVLKKRAPFFKIKEMGMIMDVFVKRKRRGEGVGSRLVQEAEDWIRDKDFKVAVMTVAPENKGAVKFWKENGYSTYLLKQRKDL